MGKGDLKSKRGKIVNGSFGVRRRRKKTTKEVHAAAVLKTPVKEEVKVKEKAAVKKKEKAK
jgi:30S ribosomal protein S31